MNEISALFICLGLGLLGLFGAGLRMLLPQYLKVTSEVIHGRRPRSSMNACTTKGSIPTLHKHSICFWILPINGKELSRISRQVENSFAGSQLLGLGPAHGHEEEFPYFT